MESPFPPARRRGREKPGKPAMPLCRLSTPSLLDRFMLAALLAWVGILVLIPAAHATAEGTVLKRIRSGQHASHARVVLELEGDRPSAVGPPSDQGFPIVFSSLRSRLRRDALRARWPAPVSSIVIEERDGSTAILIISKAGMSSVRDRVTARGLRGYDLVLDVAPLPPGQAKPPDSPQPSPHRGKGATSTGEALPEGADANPPAEPGPFEPGDALFLAHASNLAPVAAQIIEEYRSALRASPGASQAAQAYFRTGLCHLALGDSKKAEESFKQVLNNHSQHPIAPLAWMRLGEALSKRGAFIESIQALRTALTSPLEKPLVAEASYYLGKGLYHLGAHREAQVVLVKSQEEDPSGHIARPDLLRVLGECYFINQEYDKSAAYLMWYLNIERDAPGKDLLLAKIGESLMYTRDQDLAKKIYVYLDKHFPETEGWIISKIRRAEYFERQNPPNQVAASAIYEELSQHSLTGPLGEFLTFKVASWERGRKHYARALEWIETGLAGNGTPKAREELIDLKVQVLLDFIRESHASQDHARALRLFQDNQDLLSPRIPAEVLSLVAESCSMLKLHPTAAEIYQRLYTQSGGRNEEWLLKSARCYFQMGDSERTILSCLPLQGEAHQMEKALLLGKTYFEVGKYPQAAQELLKHIQKKDSLEGTDPDVLYGYAESLILSDRATDALLFLDKLIRIPALAQGEPRIRIGLMQSRCYTALKQPGQATEVLEHLLTLSPPEALQDRLNYELTRLYLESGQTSKASEKLARLAQSSNSLWKTAAEQELGYLNLHGQSPRAGSK